MGEHISEKLPNWDLSCFYAFDGAIDKVQDLRDLYTDAVVEDMQALRSAVDAFGQKYRGQVAFLLKSDMYQMLRSYEEIETIAGKIQTYAYLLYAKWTSHAVVLSFYQTCDEKINDIYQDLLFFELELGQLKEEEIKEVIEYDARLKDYIFWVDQFMQRKPYQLSEKEEKILHAKSVSSRNAWVRLFDETMSHMRFDVDGKKLTESETLNLLQHKDESVRQSAALALGRTLKEHERVLSLVTNTLAKDKAIDDDLRGFKTPVSSRNLANLIEDDVVETLIETVKESYGRLSHRYYRLKAKIMGKEKLNHWDRSAPLFSDDATYIPFEDAKKMVLDAYQRFCPEMAEIAVVFFDKGYIDAAPMEGKDGGAFSHPCVPSLHPYILMNYHGKLRDVMTLAHELGHGVHQVLASPKGYWGADTPLTLAETASVFGEMLTFRHLYQHVEGDRKRYLIASKIEDMIATVVRQTAFFDFEWHVHHARKQGEISAQNLHDMWMRISHESLGDGVILDEDYQAYWSYIPHFIHSPFYVYAYAFGDCLVNSLYRCYEEGMPGFQEKYLEMLKNGGTKNYAEAISLFGLNAREKQFWNAGLDLIEDLIDELEKDMM